MAGTKRMHVKLEELAQEIAIAHGLEQGVVDLVLEAYSTACKRALAENLILEPIQGLQLRVEPYFNPREAKMAKRVVVVQTLSREQAKTGSMTLMEEEDERATQQLSRFLAS